MGVCIIAAALIIIGAGWYISQYRPLQQIVLKVNDTEFKMDYYVKALKFYGAGQSSYYMYSLADQLPTIIEENELIRQEAMELGITVSQDEVDKELESTEPPLSKDYRDFVRAALLIEKLRDEYFEEQVPVYTEQRHIMAMFLESEKQATEIKARIDDYFGGLATKKALVRQPLELTDAAAAYDVHVNVFGGGLRGQAEAIRHGIARTLTMINADYRSILKKASLMTRDPRKKERKKYGLKGARKRFQYSKR